MNKVQKIITAGGDSRALFMSAGFGVPKSLVSIGEGTVLSLALKSYLDAGDKATVAINADEDLDFPISPIVEDFDPEIKIVRVNSSVKGALATALVAAGEMDLTSPLVIAAGDSTIKGGLASHIEKFVGSGCHSGTIAFESRNPRWSFLSVSENGRVLEVAEKEVVGPLASTGVFYFKTGQLFLEAAEWVLLNRATVNDRYYVSTSLNYLISRGLDVSYEVINRDDYAAYSLPADLVKQAD
jgi:dTDP-glucose pyrophosphorylase